jgi:hypothetical protein
MSVLQTIHKDMMHDSTARLYTFRNRLINGDMMISQRGDSFNNIKISAADTPYTLDRWRVTRTNVYGDGEVSISALKPGMRVEVTNAQTSYTGSEVFGVRQHIEGYNCYDLAEGKIAVSFKTKSNKQGTYGVMLFDNHADQYYTAAQSFAISDVDAANETVKYHTIVFDAPPEIAADNSAGLYLNFTLAADTDRAGNFYPTEGNQTNFFEEVGNYMEFYEVQLEKGSISTPFEYRPHVMEMLLCQRYCMIIEGSHYGHGNGGYFVTVPVRYPTPMRVTPSHQLKNIQVGSSRYATGSYMGEIGCTWVSERSAALYVKCLNTGGNDGYRMSALLTAEL